MAIDPTALKEKIALADFTQEERDHLLGWSTPIWISGAICRQLRTGLDIAIACDDPDIKDRLMRFLCGA